MPKISIDDIATTAKTALIKHGAMNRLRCMLRALWRKRKAWATVYVASIILKVIASSYKAAACAAM